MDRLLATKSEGVGLIVRAISFQDFQPICDHKSPASQMDGRHVIARPRFALKVHCAVKTNGVLLRNRQFTTSLHKFHQVMFLVDNSSWFVAVIRSLSNP